MKKKVLKSIVLALIMVLMVAPQVFALEIFVEKSGTVNFYQGSVLGKSNSLAAMQGRTTSETAIQDRARIETQTSTPIKTLNSSARQRIELNSDEMGEATVGITASDKKMLIRSAADEMNSPAFKKSETIDARTVNLSYPAALKSRMSESDKDKYFESRFSQRQEVQRLGEEERAAIIEEKRGKYQEYTTQLQEQRQERAEERVEIRNMYDADGKERFAIMSRNMTAQIDGANFAYDQETGEVVLTTPSGQEHILQHLPDQAISRMEEQGLFVDSEKEIEIETTEDGYVRYKAQGSKPKKFLGLFNRNVETEVVLDDLTGEASETEVTPDRFIDRLLYRLSF